MCNTKSVSLIGNSKKKNHRNKKTRFARKFFLCQSTTSCALYRINGDNSKNIQRKGRDRPVNRINSFLETAHLLQHGRDTVGKLALVLLRSGKFPLIYLCCHFPGTIHLGIATFIVKHWNPMRILLLSL